MLKENQGNEGKCPTEYIFSTKNKHIHPLCNE